MLTTALALAAGLLYLATAEETYQGQADLLVAPVVDEDPALTGLGLIRASSDPSRDVETVARLVTSRDVAARVRDELELDDSPEDLVAKVDAAPVAQSNVVTVTAEASTPELAAALANAFAEQAVEDRSEALRAQVAPLIEGLQERIAAGDDSGDLAAQLARLQTLEASGDPTVRFETGAVVPDEPVAPRPALTVIASLIGGLVLGIGGAFLLQAVDPRLRREEQLRELYGLPVLARIPSESRGGGPEPRLARPFRAPGRDRRGAPLGPSELSPRTLEAYRMLRAMLSAVVAEGEPGDGLGRAVMVTGPSPAEGKTTTAINLASSYAIAGKRVILLEGDFRRPTIAKALNVAPRVGIGKVLLREVDLEEGLVAVKPFEENLRVLPVERPDDHLSELLSMPAARELLARAREIADYVVIDSPPLTEVIDALPLARHADDVLVVARLGTSNLQQLSRLADLLEQNAIEPSGFVVVGVGSAQDGSYYLSGRTERGPELGPSDDQATGVKRVPRRPTLAER